MVTGQIRNGHNGDYMMITGQNKIITKRDYDTTLLEEVAKQLFLAEVEIEPYAGAKTYKDVAEACVEAAIQFCNALQDKKDELEITDD